MKIKYFKYFIGLAIGLLLAQMGHYKIHFYHLALLAGLILLIVLYERRGK